MDTKQRKRYISEGKAIQVFMWTSESTDPSKWQEYQPGESAMETAAASLSKAMEIVKNGLATGYTSFTLKYPIQNHGGSMNDRPKGGC